eukprot:TRINITY_DN5366_c0_g1_i1.p1 TRINITY_DN5366_c0_g1~~TRINITY_DN5366_c0_g1_i1.p1  ORF type:complete len:781 (-),score=204.49 TRINITY_DN5366_c0_g1_i1:118-2346(-)
MGGSEYLYERAEQQGWSLNDYVQPEEEDDTELVNVALENIRPLLEGGTSISDEDLIDAIRQANYSVADTWEILFSSAIPPPSAKDGEGSMFAMDFEGGQGGNNLNASGPVSPPPGLGFSSESIGRGGVVKAVTPRTPGGVVREIVATPKKSKQGGDAKVKNVSSLGQSLSQSPSLSGVADSKLFENETLASLAKDQQTREIADGDDLKRFDFSTPSPDDEVLAQQARAFQKGGGKAKKSSGPAFQAKSRLEEQQRRAAKEADGSLSVGSTNPLSVSGESGRGSSKKKDVPQTVAKRKELILKSIASSDEKEHLNLVVIGHVDAGKSTIMGHLLLKTGEIDQKSIRKFEKESKQAGKSSFHFAWVLDAHSEERDRGVTIDVAVSKFETESKKITLLDAPGHREFVPNMITGAAQADSAVLVLNAVKGEFEAGYREDGQTKEHVQLAKSLGVSSLIVAVNKMDAVDYDEDRYNEIVSEVSSFLKKSGFSKKSVTFLPLSGFVGENLESVTKDCALKEWYKGPTLMKAIDSLSAPPRMVETPTRLVVSDVYKNSQIGLSTAVGGKIEAGYVAKGDRLLLLPLNELCQVKIVRTHDTNVDFAPAGRNVELGLVGIDLSQITVGSILCDPLFPVPMVSRFKAQLITFHALKMPLLAGSEVNFHAQNVAAPGKIAKLYSILDPRSGDVIQKKPKALGKTTSAVVVIQLNRPLCLELYSNYKKLGRFTIRDRGRTLAAGIITKFLVDRL